MQLRFIVVLLGLAFFVSGARAEYEFFKFFEKLQLSAGETVFAVYVTGYSYWDNTPEQSYTIAFPAYKDYETIHDEAGGSGTYHDPITLAVGHRSIDKGYQPDFEPATLFYIPDLKKYAIVEDVCGDGPEPENGPCHQGFEGYEWLDVWVGGEETGSLSAASECEDKITGLHEVIMNPKQGYPVREGAVYSTEPCA